VALLRSGYGVTWVINYCDKKVVGVFVRFSCAASRRGSQDVLVPLVLVLSDQ
jgi:hypothetical protein